MPGFLSPAYNHRRSLISKTLSTENSVSLNITCDSSDVASSRGLRSPTNGLPLSINKIYRRMYSNGFGYSSSPPDSASSPPSNGAGGLVLRQYLIPRNPNNRLYQLYKNSPPSPASSPLDIHRGCIPLFADAPQQIMGAFLDKPRTEKSNESGQGAGLHYGIAAMQGWRIEMEDAHTARAGTDLPAPWNDWAFFAIFDGHAGAKVARYCSNHLLEAIWEAEEMQELAKQLPLQKLEQSHIDGILKAIRHGFLSLDERMRQFPDLHGENERSGSTAVCCIMSPSHLFVGNLGDSRALISRNGHVHFATEDHKPYLPKERDRIVSAGGSVMIQRVNGSLAVSRAMGDYEYKSVPGVGQCQQLVSPEPDVHFIERDLLQSGDGKDEFVLLACDGVFDVMNNSELCDFVRSRLRVTDRLELICNQILDSCLSKGSKDNMSVILVTFPGAPQVSNEAVDKERELEVRLRDHIHGIIEKNEIHLENDIPEDVDSILILLSKQEIPGVPPGAGVHAMRPLVESILISRANNGSGSKNSPSAHRHTPVLSPAPSSPRSQSAGEDSNSSQPTGGAASPVRTPIQHATTRTPSSGSSSPLVDSSSRSESPAVVKLVAPLAASPLAKHDSDKS